MATTNLNLNTLAGTEKLKSFPTPYNDNMGAIDDAFGSGFGVGNNSSVDDELNGLGNGMAIIANGNTHAAITSGQYVYVRQHGSLSEGLYKATANISANGTLSGSNLTAVSSGGLNDVYSTLNSKLTSYVDYVRVNYGSNSFFIYWKVGKIVCVDINYNVLDGAIQAWSSKEIGTLPSGFRPRTGLTKTRLISDREASDAVYGNVTSDGKINIYAKYKPFEAAGSIATGTMVFPTTE